AAPGHPGEGGPSGLAGADHPGSFAPSGRVDELDRCAPAGDGHDGVHRGQGVPAGGGHGPALGGAVGPRSGRNCPVTGSPRVGHVTTAARSLTDVLDRSLIDKLVDGIVASPRAERYTTLAPFSGTPLAELPLSTTDDVATAYQAAAAAQRGWAARPLRERARIVGRIHDLVLDRQSTIADVIQAESGKARRDAFEEIGDVALAARYAAV